MIRLELFEFKNRPWLLLIGIPIPFLLFLLNFMFYFLIVPESFRNGVTFFIPMVVFYCEILALNHLLAKFRYINSGTLEYNGDQICFSHNEGEDQIKWSEISSVIVYYAGDERWKKQWSEFLRKLKVYRRYNNTHWYGFNKLDLRVLDRIKINETVYFVKIKNQADKDSLFELNELAHKHSIPSKIHTDDLTMNFFGKKLQA